MKKRILFLNYEFPPLGGGAGNATYYLLKEFSKYEDLEVDLITSSTDKYKKEEFAKNINIFYLDVGKKGNIHFQSNKDLLRYSYKASKFIKKLRREKKYDLVHAFFGIPCGYLAMKTKLPYIVSLRGSDVPFYNKRFYFLDKLLFKRLSKKIWGKSKKVIANSDGLRKLANSSSPNQGIDLIYNGVDINEFFPSNNINEFFTIISTSRLINRKGISYLLEAFIEFNRKYNKTKLILVGSGDLEEELKSRIQLAGISSAVDFIGAINHDELPNYYKQADVFVLPSLNEGMSNSLLEAMSSGLAIVATNTGGTAELVDQNNGIIIKKGNQSDIINALEKMYLDKKLLHDYGANSRRKVETMSWQVAASRYNKIYELA